MANFTVRNIPEDIYERLRQRAKGNERSLNAEILAILSDEDRWALRRLEMKRAIPKLRRMREDLAKKYGPFTDSVELIREDRDTR